MNDVCYEEGLDNLPWCSQWGRHWWVLLLMFLQLVLGIIIECQESRKGFTTQFGLTCHFLSRGAVSPPVNSCPELRAMRGACAQMRAHKANHY
jgi:hypothetical protein